MLRETIEEWKREDKAANESHKRERSSTTASRSSLMALEKGKFDVFTEESFGDMEIIREIETGNEEFKK